MTSIVNLFSNFDDLTKPKSVTDGATNYNNNTNLISQSLNQGNKFKKYQNKINSSLEKNADILSGIEGFQNENVGLTEQTNNLLKTTDISSQKQTIMNLQKQYDNKVNEYKSLVDKINKTTNDYINRVNPNNPLLNKTVKFTTGHIAYVTNQGIVKYIPSVEILNSVNVPKKIIPLNIPWDDSWNNNPGMVIPTKPSLISGTFMEYGQSLGNEGLNVYVDKLVTNSKANYKGCYADDTSSRTMTFIGGSPPPPNLIQNGNFSESKIAKNTYKFLTWDTTTVPGWNFYCVLANNSKAWGYPMPYPNGDQCASLQKTQELWTANYIQFTPNVTYTLSFYACGRNCCDKSGIANNIDVGLEGVTFYSFTPPINKWTKYSTNFTANSEGGQRISFIGRWSSSDRSSAIQGVEIISNTSTSAGTYTYGMCKNEALNGGYKYFALQNVNTETSKGYCAVSNDSIAPTNLGTAYAITKVVPLWDSKTSGTGTSATLVNNGSLTVFNSSGTSVFNTDNSTAQPSNYLGCYLDKSKRAMAVLKGTNMDYASCKQAASDTGNAYFGLQNSTSGKNAECWFPDYKNDTRMYGKASNCTKISDGTYSGGGWSNAIYSMDSTSFYYLILQDDGNMCIYRGTGPNDNQGEIWCSKTNGKKQKANPKYEAAKGKYGKNWISSGNTLAKGDFIGSTDGSIYLIMESDGNLVLYTSQTGENCQKMKDGNTGGGADANALYELTEMGFPANLGKVSYIDGNSKLYSYPESKIGLSNDYSSYTNYSSPGNDISGSGFSNATVDSCKSSCNNMKNCYGFDFDKTNKICYPKNNKMYPKGSKNMNTSIDLYVRKPKITSPPIGVTDKILNINSITYENYPKSNKEIKNSYDLSKATSVQKQQLEQLQSTMNTLSSQISSLTTKFDTNSQELEKQTQTNSQGIRNYVKDIKNTNTKIKGFNTNIDNILNDSDIVVLQKNYDYLFWSIIATASVLISMNIVKKN